MNGRIRARRQDDYCALQRRIARAAPGPARNTLYGELSYVGGRLTAHYRGPDGHESK